MVRIRRAGVLALMFALGSACSREAADLAGLEPGWNAVAAGDEAVCSDGSPYRFLVRPGDPEKLLVYFAGGGSCWDGLTCDTDLEPVPYTVNLEGLDPGRAHGIFAFDQPENPFQAHSVVFAPYCSADVHLGDSLMTYESPSVRDHIGHSVTIHHKGMVNAGAVLDWTSEHFFAPESVFVAGSSAGSIPSPYYAMELALLYPDADVAQLGDASSGYRRDGMTITPEAGWGTLERLRFLPEFEDLAAGDMSFELLYVAAANRAPRVRFAAFDHAEDSVQKDFLELAGIPRASLLPLILANQSDIRDEVEQFRSYIAPGDIHTILLRPEFYTLEAGGMRILDWVAALAGGGDVPDVRCAGCALVE